MNARGFLQEFPIDLFPDGQAIVKTIAGWIKRGECPRQIVTLNACMLIRALDYPPLRKVIRRADLVTVDGYGIEKALIKQGYTPGARIAGVDLVRKLLTECVLCEWPVFFYGGPPQICQPLRMRVSRQWPGIIIGGIHDGFTSKVDFMRIRQEIKQSRSRVLLAGLGTPTQELFLAELLPQIGEVVGIGVGGTLEVLAGVRREAPRLLRTHGWEWCYRMLRQPRKFLDLGDLFRFWQIFLR